MTKHQKKQKVTWGSIVAVGILLLVFDIVIALSSLKGILYGLSILEIIGIGALILRATWDSLPKGVQKELRKLK